MSSDATSRRNGDPEGVAEQRIDISQYGDNDLNFDRGPTATGTPATDNNNVESRFVSVQSQPFAATSRSDSTARTNKPGPRSPTPYRPGPESIRGLQPRTDIDSPIGDTNHRSPPMDVGYARSTLSDPLPRPAQSARNSVTPAAPGELTTHASTRNPLRIPQFSRLEGVIPAEQLSHLRVLGVQYGMQAGKLSTIGEYLGTVSVQFTDIRNHADSVSGRIQ